MMNECRPPTGSGRWCSLVCALTVLATASPAFANGFDLYGMGSRGTAMGNAGLTTAEDYSALYYNPAAMVLGGSTVGGGLFLTPNGLDIRLSDRPDGYDIPNLGTNSPAIPTEFRLRERSDPETPRPHASIFGGATSDLGIEGLRFGVAAMLPVSTSDDVVSAFNDEREQYFSNTLRWDLIGTRVEHPYVLFGAAYQPTDWISIGLGASYLPSTQLNNFVLLPDLTRQDEIDLNVGLSIPSHFAPHVGIMVMPRENVRAGITWRETQRLRLVGENEIQVRGLQESEDDFPFIQEIDIVLWYSPRQFAAGMSWNNDTLLLSLDVTYTVWSDFVDNHNVNPGFSDTFTPRLGAEIQGPGSMVYRMGLVYEQSPVPDQTGRTNFVDNDRLVASIGTGHRFQMGEGYLNFSWHLQPHFLLPRETVKSNAGDEDCEPGVTDICDEVPENTINPATDEPFPEAQGLQTGNPGFPGFSSGGWLLNAGVEVSWDF